MEMMRKEGVMLALVLVLVSTLLLLGACAPQPEKQCTTDKDCVPAVCCHPSDAVNRENAPDCRGILCTQECVPGTIDCNQGVIRCVKDTCAVVLKE